MADDFDDDNLPPASNFRVTRQKEDNDLDDDPMVAQEPDLERWTAWAMTDTATAARQVQQAVTRSTKEYNEKLWRELVHAYVLAKIVSGPGRKWGEFVSNPFWERPGHKPKIDDRTKPLKWMMQFVFDARDDRAKARASEYRGALQAKFDANADPATIFDYLKNNGGVEALYRSNLPGNRQGEGGGDEVWVPEEEEEEFDDPPAEEDDSDDVAAEEEEAGSRSNEVEREPTNAGTSRSRALVVAVNGHAVSEPLKGREVITVGQSVEQRQRGGKQGAARKKSLASRAREIVARGKVPVLVAADLAQLDLISKFCDDQGEAILDIRLSRREKWVDIDCVDVTAER